jgi:hypothetical protein
MECHALDGEEADCFVPCPSGTECRRGIESCVAVQASMVCVVIPSDCPSCNCTSDGDCARGNGGVCDVATGTCYCTQDDQCASGYICVPG